jgi:hypothetical protein
MATEHPDPAEEQGIQIALAALANADADIAESTHPPEGDSGTGFASRAS